MSARNAQSKERKTDEKRTQICFEKKNDKEEKISTID
jgi:hypothetical protein